MAAIYQRKNQYYVDYSVDGRRVRKVIGPDRAEAELYLSEVKYRLHRGDLAPRRPDVPVHLAITRYLSNCRLRVAATTCKRYKDALTHFRNYLLTNHPISHISQVNRSVITNYPTYRLTCKPKPKNKTINHEMIVVRAFLYFCVEAGYVESNPARKIKLLPEKDSKKGRVISQEEIERLLKVSDEWFREIIVVFLCTGMRLGELINLQWSDVDLEKGLIHIQEKEDWSPKTYERTIPINSTAHQIISRLTRSHKYVFTHKNKKIPTNHLRKVLIKYARKCGLQISRLHDLRHTFCSNLLMRNVPVPTVSELLGHKSWKTTMIYAHQSEEHKREAVSKLQI